ncbi:preprotein translocase subunit SecE [Paraoerskovia marina]|uniref:Protein translocase subunit SecE n=1 Tax=Paraoerskovia marina TaxID=545619 RepID=A0A1H1VDZ9_9CELL|nr:preprotein translocase subunit SecE [Paraoerskovia marina]SDS82994.1 protein translocase subunit secE/sec61 gamma [Paraoerskovia marina]
MSESPSGAVEAGAGDRRADGKRPNIFARIAIFVRQVIAELGKVVTPTRSELGTYFVVVIVFLVVMMGFITLIDYLIGIGTLALFG